MTWPIMEQGVWDSENDFVLAVQPDPHSRGFVLSVCVSGELRHALFNEDGRMVTVAREKIRDSVNALEQTRFFKSDRV